MKIKKDINTFYNFYQDGVTQSMIKMWLDCPQACKLCYIEGWTPKTVSESLIFGNIVHWNLENGYSGTFPPPDGVLSSWINEACENYNLFHDDYDLDIVQTHEIIAGKAEGIMRTYWKVYATDFEWNWQLAETIFKVPYKFSDGQQTYITGKLDAGFQTEKSSDKLDIMDHKTMGQINWDHILTLLPVDLQINIYCWAIRELFQTPSSFYYNIIRNPGKKPSVRKKETIDDFISRIEAESLEEKDRHFYRTQVPVNNSAIDKFKKEQLDPIMKAMRKWYDSKFRYPSYINVERLKTRYGLNPYTEAILSNDFSRLYQRDKPFQELH